MSSSSISSSTSSTNSTSSSSSSSSSGSSSPAPPPPPGSPHPDIIKALDSVRVPEVRYHFNRTTGILRGLLHDVSEDNFSRWCVINRDMVMKAKKVTTLAGFCELLTLYLDSIRALVRSNRNFVKRFMKRLGADRSGTNRNQFALTKRVMVWRDAVESVRVLATQDGASWTEGYRGMLWRRLVVATEAGWYCTFLKSTFHRDELVE